MNTRESVNGVRFSAMTTAAAATADVDRFRQIMLDASRSQLETLCREWAVMQPGSPEAIRQEYWIRRFQAEVTNLQTTDPVLPYIKLDPNLPDLIRGSEHAAGIDLYNAGSLIEIPPGGTAVISCGIQVAIPGGYYGHVAIRSGLGFKSDMYSHIGVVDADFRGEVKVKLFKHFNLFEVIDVEEATNRAKFRLDKWRENTIRIERYDRIAQLVILPYFPCTPVPTDDLSITKRGAGGYGSTGA